MTARILLVEDDPGVSMVVSDLLAASGYVVACEADGPGGLRRAMSEDFDVLILDIMLPRYSGVEICAEMRQRGFDGGILLLTAKGQVSDRVKGLRSGADDYLTKPFAPDELVARVEALLRRVHKEDLTPVLEFRFGAVVADFENGVFLRAGKRLNLAAKEADLLRFLVNRRGQVVSREEILKHVWAGQPFISERTVDVHVSWLRQKLEDDPQSPRYILTARGVGYRFHPDSRR